MTFYHVTPWENVAAMKRQGLKPRRIKRGIFAQDPEEPRIYLFVDRNTAEDAMMNWLLDEYPYVRYFGIVAIDFAESAPIAEDPELAGSVYVTQAIPPSLIRGIEKIDVGIE